MSGRAGNGSTQTEATVANGSFRFIVESEGGRSITYKTRPHNSNSSNTIWSTKIATGSLSRAKRITIYKSRFATPQKWPTPGPKARVLTMLQSRDWIVANPTALEIPRLEGFEARTIPGEMRCQHKEQSSPRFFGACNGGRYSCSPRQCRAYRISIGELQFA